MDSTVRARSRSTTALLLLAGLAGMSLPASAGAAVFPVTTTADITNGADGVTSLREAVALAGGAPGADTITLSPGAHVLSDCGAGELLHDGAGGDLAIEGAGASVAQTCDATRIIRHTQSGTLLSITGLSLIGSPNAGAIITQGAAIQSTSRLVLTDVSITGVNAGPGGSVVEFDFGPGDFDAELHDVTITGNTGSAVTNISNPAGILVDGSTLSGNTGGGVIIGDGSPVVITDSTISDNGGYGVFTTGQGFGLQPIVTISGTTIDGNGRGGFTCRNGCRSLTVTDSTITGNGASAVAGQGGGLEFVTFQPAFATPSITITGSTVSGNRAVHDGGGLLVDPGQAEGDTPVEITITDSVLSGNDADCATCNGGAVAAQTGNLALSGVTMDGNAAGLDGGAVFHTRDVTDTASENFVFSATASTFSGNTAGGDGGGIATGGRAQTITTSRLTGNTAGGVGGGLQSYGVLPLAGASTLAVTRSTIDGNSAEGGGGVYLGAGALADLTNATITGNTATTAGGGIALNLLSGADLVHVTLTDNAATAGANLAASSPVTLDRSVVSGPAGGGTNCGAYLGLPVTVTSIGHSWFDDATCNAIATDTVAPGADPGLAALAAAGGPTPTRVPLVGSPLLAAIPLASCTTPSDQRGLARPQGPGCEPGAVEVVTAPAAEFVGTNRSDLLTGTAVSETIRGLAGHDVLLGAGGDDVLVGGPGNDLLIGGPGNDTLQGGPGVDMLIGAPGTDTYSGGPGPDLCFMPGQVLPADC